MRLQFYYNIREHYGTVFPLLAQLLAAEIPFEIAHWDGCMYPGENLFWPEQHEYDVMLGMCKKRCFHHHQTIMVGDDEDNYI